MQVMFARVNGLRIADVPNGQLIVSKVPGHGYMGVLRPNGGRKQVLLPAGKVKKINLAMNELVEAWKWQVGIGVDTARFVN